MKAAIIVVLCVACVSCSQPLTVTTRPDPHTATSGTLGSAHFNNKLPEPPPVKTLPDTLMRRDSL